jgi:hypothetical protein
LLTDFGHVDPYVGIMKAVMHGISPGSVFIDLSHEVPAQEVRVGGLLLDAAVPYLPRGTVVLAVVDPGVGTVRRPLAAEAGGLYFVGPDNGILSLALAHFATVRVVELTSEAHRLKRPSHTFHGRDIFSPAAAHLAAGVSLSDLGPSITDWLTIDWPRPERSASGWEGEVLHIDHFGNAVTNIDGALAPLGSSVEVSENTRVPVCIAYGDVLPGTPVALVGSTGRLEVSVNGGNAAAAFGLVVGSTLRVRLDDRSDPT